MINRSIIETLILRLKERNDIQYFQHAYRVNGIVDIYKKSGTVYDRKKNQYHKFTEIKPLEEFVFNVLSRPIINKPTISKQQVIKVEKKTTTTKITYKQLVSEVIPKANNDHLAAKPEDYHWFKNQEKGNDDLYFIFHNEFVKIGRSRDMLRRISQLKTSFSCEYHCYLMYGKGFMEKKMHHIFSEYRKAGEWFAEHPRMREFISKRLQDGTAKLFIESDYKKSQRKDRKPSLELTDIMTYKKHKGKTIQQVFEEDYGYMLWLESTLKNFYQIFGETVRKEMLVYSRKEQIPHQNIQQ